MVELRLAGIVDRESANGFLPGFIARFNERFAVRARDEQADWLPVPRQIDLDRVLVLKYRRKVAKDHTVRLDGRVMALPKARYAYSGRTVEVHLRLDGSMVAFDGRRQLALTPAPSEPRQLRAQQADRVAPSLEPARATLPWTPPADHPWRRVRRGTKLYEVRLTESLSR